MRAERYIWRPELAHDLIIESFVNSGRDSTQLTLGFYEEMNLSMGAYDQPFLEMIKHFRFRLPQ